MTSMTSRATTEQLNLYFQIYFSKLLQVKHLIRMIQYALFVSEQRTFNSKAYDYKLLLLKQVLE